MSKKIPCANCGAYQCSCNFEYISDPSRWSPGICYVKRRKPEGSHPDVGYIQADESGEKTVPTVYILQPYVKGQPISRYVAQHYDSVAAIIADGWIVD